MARNLFLFLWMMTISTPCWAQGLMERIKDLMPSADVEGLRLEILTDKDVYSVGELIKITTVIKNVGNIAILISNDKDYSMDSSPRASILYSDDIYEGSIFLGPNNKMGGSMSIRPPPFPTEIKSGESMKSESVFIARRPGPVHTVCEIERKSKTIENKDVSTAGKKVWTGKLYVKKTVKVEENLLHKEIIERYGIMLRENDGAARNEAIDALSALGHSGLLTLMWEGSIGEGEKRIVDNIRLTRGIVRCIVKAADTRFMMDIMVCATKSECYQPDERMSLMEIFEEIDRRDFHYSDEFTNSVRENLKALMGDKDEKLKNRAIEINSRLSGRFQIRNEK